MGEKVVNILKHEVAEEKAGALGRWSYLMMALDYLFKLMTRPKRAFVRA